MTKKPVARVGRFGVSILLVGAVGVVALLLVVSRSRSPGPTNTAAPADLVAAGVLKGDSSAAVEVQEFADFACPACGRFATITGPDVMRRLVASGQISIRFMDMPSESGLPAHVAAHCANEQGKFWEMHDRLFGGQFDWLPSSPARRRRYFRGYAEDVGLDVAQWGDCFDSGRVLPQILANQAEARRLRLRYTPSFLIGDQLVEGLLTFDQFRAYVENSRASTQSPE